jgi:hypothetical protein
LLPLFCACSTSIESDGSGGATSAAVTSSEASGLPANSWRNGACGQCIETQCPFEVNACEGDPECADWLSCVNRCPPHASDSDADPACEVACPIAQSSTAERAKKALETCRLQGEGATGCPTCEHVQSGHPLLNQQCPKSKETNGCYICEDEHCCETFAAYFANPEAVATKECILACHDDQCEYQCLLDHPEGVRDWGRRITCVLTFCSTADTCLDVPPDPCIPCLNNACAEAQMQCAEDPACFLIEQCIGRDSCLNECVGECADSYPSGKERYFQSTACYLTYCAEECSATPSP